MDGYVVLVIFPLKLRSFGTIDFAQYWSGWNLLINGQIPYQSIFANQGELDVTLFPGEITHSWNPPWTYTLLSPVVSLPFTASAIVWCLLEVSALFFIALRGPQALKTKGIGVIWGAVSVLVFLPSLYSIQYGQLGILFAFSLTTFLLAVNSKAYAWAGLSLIPLTAKPHLFLLCAIPGVLWLTQIPARDAARFLSGSVGGFVALVGATVAIAPTSFSNWLHAITIPAGDAQVVHLTSWMTHTTATATRLFLIDTINSNPTWPLTVIPAIAYIATLLYFIIRRPIIEWSTLLPRVLCISLGTSSYGWIYDQTVLVLCPLLLVSIALSRESARSRALIISAALLPQLISLAYVASSQQAMRAFFILPWVYLLLLLIVLPDDQKVQTRHKDELRSPRPG